MITMILDGKDEGIVQEFFAADISAGVDRLIDAEGTEKSASQSIDVMNGLFNSVMELKQKNFQKMQRDQ